MKMLRLVLPIVCLSGLALFAEEYPEFTRWMKATDMATGNLRKMDQKVGPQAVRSAEILGVVYEEMIGFFRQQGGANAVKWSSEGKAAANALASAAFAGDAQAAESAFKAINGTCRNCHDAYRARSADGKYAFKPFDQRGKPSAAPAKPSSSRKS